MVYDRRGQYCVTSPREVNRHTRSIGVTSAHIGLTFCAMSLKVTLNQTTEGEEELRLQEARDLGIDGNLNIMELLWVSMTTGKLRSGKSSMVIVEYFC